jgi:myo-inositol-1(or 4)-monophosphatase
MKKHFLDVAIQAAKASGRIQKRNLSGNYRIHYKGTTTNLVTEVDLRCEKRILSLIGEHFPDHDYYAEEKGKTDKRSTYRWLVDPLDGTTNYAHGYPSFWSLIPC